MIGRTLGHYRIVEKIGAGGMGEVYRAHDQRLERDVALKVLPAGTLTDQSARKKFRQEALTLSKLNHPHIAHVYDFDSQQGVDFLVMEYVTGATLKEKLAEGPLPEKEITRLAAQVADALATAHGKGVVHRDLKPANIALTGEGQAKVLDFGLAKLVQSEAEGAEAATVESLTQTAGVAGTLPYMAPEQLRGEAVDARTDIHALGAVLYEMATGQRPFRGELAPQLTDAILHQTPVTPRALSPRVSPELERIILKALEKDRALRYQSAAEIVADVKRLQRDSGLSHGPSPPAPAAAEDTLVQTGNVKIARRDGSMVIDVVEGKEAIHVAVPARSMRTFSWVALVALMIVAVVLMERAGWFEGESGPSPTAAIGSVAVLPLNNLMNDPEQDYFVDGMTEALIAELSKIGALKVISRTSVMQYKGVKKPLPDIAQELGVEAIVEGSVLRSGERVRITAQLIDASTDEHLWADNFDRDLSDVLALHSEVARAIAREIKVAVTPEEEARLARTRRVNPEAHEAYLRGQYYMDKYTEESFEKARGYFQQAIAADPDYALAYVGLASSYRSLGLYAVLPLEEVIPRIEAAAEKAVALDDTLAESHASLAGFKKAHAWDWEGAEKEYQLAIELDPNSALAHSGYAGLLSILGRHEEALAESETALELNPLSLTENANAASYFYFARKHDQAIEQLHKTLELDPDYDFAYYLLGLTLVAKGSFSDAISALEKSVQLSGGSAVRKSALGYAYAVAGRNEEARKILEELLDLSRQRQGLSFPIASIYAGLGENGQAFAWLEKDYKARSSFMRFVKVDARLDSIRSDPRFQTLLRRMNFPE